MVIQFSIPAPDCAPCCPTCLEDGTELDVTFTGITVCTICIEDAPIWYEVLNPEDLLGTHAMEINGGETDVTGIMAQKYSDSGCTVPDGAPVELTVRRSLSCVTGSYQVTVYFLGPSSGLSTGFVFATAAVNGGLDTEIPNDTECGGGDNAPFIIDSIEIHSPP